MAQVQLWLGWAYFYFVDMPYSIVYTTLGNKKGTRRGKSLVAAGHREVATGVVWACTAS
jgi:hypothetical protein